MSYTPSGLPGEPPAILKQEGLCASPDIDTNIFFPGDGESHQKAMKLCAECPVWRTCMQWAIDNSEYGGWGGSTEEDRKIARRYRAGGSLRSMAYPKDLPHGSMRRSYVAHLEAGELPCEICHHTWCSNYPKVIINQSSNRKGKK